MHRVVVLALEGVYPFELGIAHRVFATTDQLYEVITCTVDGGPVRSDSDVTVGVSHGPEALESADTVIIPPFSMALISADLSPAVRGALARVRPGARIVSICTGAFVLAAAGLLDGRPATTHWALAEAFRTLFPGSAPRSGRAVHR